MEVAIPQHTLCTSDILNYVDILEIPNFSGVKMRDELKGKSKPLECGIINLNTSAEKGSHWTAYYCSNSVRYHFDSFGEPPPIELLKYLKSNVEYSKNIPALKRSALTVQHDKSSECGGLCLFVLKSLSMGIPFPDIIVFLDNRYHRLPTDVLKIVVSGEN